MSIPQPTACCQCHTGGSPAHAIESVCCAQCIYAAAFEKKHGRADGQLCPTTPLGYALCCCVPAECIGFFCIRGPSGGAFVAECVPYICCFGSACAMNEYRKGSAGIIV